MSISGKQHDKRNFFTPLLLASSCLIPLPAWPQNTTETALPDASSFKHKITLGTFYSRGNYGAHRDTEIAFLPASYEIARFPWIVSVTVPWLALEGPGDVFLEAGNLSRPEASREYISERGLGDVTLSATYQLPSLLNDLVFLDLTLQAKLPSADEDRDLGTGELDLSYQLDLYGALDSLTLFSSIGYRQRGRTALYDLQDNAFLSLGVLQELGGDHSVGLIYDYREAASTNAHELHELMPFYSWSPDPSWNLMVYTIVGFTDSSAEQAVGVQVSYSW